MTYSNTKTNTKTKLFTMVVGANNEHYKTREKILEQLWANSLNDNYQTVN